VCATQSVPTLRSKKENYNLKVVVFWLYLSGKSNSYGYCVNNPLKYTDISGNDFGLSLLIAVAVAIATNVVATVIQGDHLSFSSIVESAAMATFSCVVTFGIGTAVGTIGNFFVRASVQALAHGVFQGGMTAMQGGNFWNGFAAGSISSIASSLWQGGFNHEGLDAKGNMINPTKAFGGIGGTSGASMIAFGTIAGGAGAALTGGNFWQGAVTGLIVSGLNHAAHAIGEENTKNKITKAVNKMKAENESNGNVCGESTLYVIDLTDDQLKNVAIIPENAKNNTDLIRPTKNGAYNDVDGVYINGSDKRGNQWYKIADGDYHVLYNNRGSITPYDMSCRINPCYYAAYLKGGRGWKTYEEKHWTINPFTNR
jgi:hypothetical protein